MVSRRAISFAFMAMGFLGTEGKKKCKPKTPTSAISVTTPDAVHSGSLSASASLTTPTSSSTPMVIITPSSPSASDDSMPSSATTSPSSSLSSSSTTPTPTSSTSLTTPSTTPSTTSADPSTTAAFSTSSTSAACVPDTREYLENPSFETGNSPWYIEGIVKSGQYQSVQAHDGNNYFFGRLEESSAIVTVSQVLQDIPLNKEYKVTGWYGWGDTQTYWSASPTCSIMFFIRGGSVSPQTPISAQRTPGLYSSVEWSFTPTEANPTLVINVYCDTPNVVDFMLDDFSVKLADDPCLPKPTAD